MEDRLRAGLQLQRHHRLRDSVRRPWARPASSCPPPCGLGISTALHRRREVRPRRHPIPDLVQIVLQIFLELLDGLPIHPGRTLVRLDPLVRLPHEPLRYVKRLSFRTSTCPLVSSRTTPVVRANKSPDEPAPSLHPHYRGFTTTTSRSASRRRIGTRRLTVSAARRTPSRHPPTPTENEPVSALAFPRSMQKPQTGLAPPPCRTPPGQSTGTRQAHPGTYEMPRFRCQLIISTRHQRFARARLPDPHLTHHVRLFLNAHHDGLQPTQLEVV